MYLEKCKDAKSQHSVSTILQTKHVSGVVNFFNLRRRALCYMFYVLHSLCQMTSLAMKEELHTSFPLECAIRWHTPQAKPDITHLSPSRTLTVCSFSEFRVKMLLGLGEDRVVFAPSTSMRKCASTVSSVSVSQTIP